VFDYATQDQLYKDLHSLALTNNVALGGPTGVAAPVDTPVEAKSIASSKKSKKK
jgi:hypothetical protein